METPWISLSYTEITSTFRWHQSVTAFCQSTILRGSYDAFRRSVCSISPLRVLSASVRRTASDSARRLPRCQGNDTRKHRGHQRLASVLARVKPVQSRAMFRRCPVAGTLLGAIALSVFASACASSRTAPRPFPTKRPPIAAPVPELPSEMGVLNGLVVRAALELRGVPYRNGGSDLSGFDCSGFTQY